MKVEDGRARLTVRLYAAETQVLAELEKQGEKPSSLGYNYAMKLKQKLKTCGLEELGA